MFHLKLISRYKRSLGLYTVQVFKKIGLLSLAKIWYKRFYWGLQ